jgi:hypothetical protein
VTSPERLTPDSIKRWQFKRDTAMVGIDRSAVTGFQMAVMREITALYDEQYEQIQEIRRLSGLVRDWARAYDDLKYELWDLQTKVEAANGRGHPPHANARQAR